MISIVFNKMRLLFLYFLLVCLIPTHINSQVKLPDTPAGKRGQQILDILNSKSEIEPKEFVKQNCAESFKSRIPEAQWGGMLKQLKNMSPSVDLIKINKSEEYEVEFVTQLTSNKMYLTVTVITEQVSPNKIEAMGFAPGGGPATNNVQPTPQQTDKKKISVNTEVFKKINEYLEDQANKNKLSGSVLLAKDGKILFEKSIGYASKRFKVPNNRDTKFNLASIGKLFTAVAILQLIEAGKIGIDDPIGKYLDMFPKEVGEKVKIRQLLDMTNGWGDYWGNEYFLAHKDELRELSDYMEFIKDIPLEFEPGTTMKHSNIGYEVAGAVIEKVSGMDYFDYVREKIFKPAGMLNTDNYDRDSPVENLAVGYTNLNPLDKQGNNFEWENTFLLSPRGTPAGGAYSTTEDMLKFDNALRSGKLVGKKYVDFMGNRWQGNIGDPYVQVRIPRSAGGANGASTLFARDMNNGFTIIVLTNYDHPVGIDIGNEIIKILGLE